MKLFERDLDRRHFLRYGGVAGALVGMDRLLPSWLGAGGLPSRSDPGVLDGSAGAWYHSHSRLQEQLGHYGPLVIDPGGPEPEPFDREHVVVLSDWSFESPYRILPKLKKHPDYYNFGKRTVLDFFRDVSEKGLGATVEDRLAWGRMRMMPSDISDITAHTYSYLLNGLGPNATGPAASSRGSGCASASSTRPPPPSSTCAFPAFR